MKYKAVFVVACLIAAMAMGLRPARSEDLPPAPELAPGDLPRLVAEIKPQPGESPWRDIPWLTNVTEARRRAVAEDKPIVIFTAADGSPLSRT